MTFKNKHHEETERERIAREKDEETADMTLGFILIILVASLLSSL